MSVVANVAVNLDTRGVVEKLRQIHASSKLASQSFTSLSSSADKVRRSVEASQGGFAKASEVQGVFSAKVRNTEAAIKAQIAALRDIQSRVQLNGALYQKAAEQIAEYEKVLTKTGQTGSRVSKVLQGFGGALASIGTTALVAGMVRGAASAEQLQLRLKLLTKEYGETAEAQQFVSTAAKQFGLSNVEAAEGVTDLYARLRPVGVSLDKIKTVFNGFNAVALASGASSQAAAGALLQLSQALGSGRLQGDEFRSIAEQVPGILQLVAKEMGVTVGQLKQLGSDGKITSDILINSLAKGFEENKGKIDELLALSPAQKFKQFQNATSELSNTMGSELLPAITPIVELATKLVNAFGQLPGPVKTLIAAVFGLTAAFVALAPAISAVSSLLSGIALGGLIAAGPWIALAAGITAAAVALGSYRNEAQKLGAAAKGGGAAEVAAARNKQAQVGQEISLLERQRQDATGRERAAIDRKLAAARKSYGQLGADIRAGETAAKVDVVTPTVPTVTPPGGAAGAGAKKPTGKSDAEREAERAAEQERQIQERLKGLSLETQALQQLGILRDAQLDAELTGNKELQNQLALEERIFDIRQGLARELLGESDERVRIAMQTKAEQQAAQAVVAAMADTMKQEAERKKALEDITRGLQDQIDLTGPLTDEQRRALEFEKQIAQWKRDGVVKTEEEIDALRKLNNELEKRQKFTTQQTITAGLNETKKQLDELTNVGNIVVNSANAIGDAFGQAFRSIASGAASTKEVLAEFFQNVANAFLDMAAQIIAKQVVMITLQAILKALGGAGGEGGNMAAVDKYASTSSPETMTDVPILAKGGVFSPQGHVERYAQGGVVTAPTMFRFAKGSGFAPGLMGEAGPEAILPLQRTPSGDLGVRATLQVPYASKGNQDLQVPYTRAGEQYGTMTGDGMIRFESTVINNQEFVTKDEAERIGQAAATRGAEIAQRRMKNSPQVRRSLGIA